VSSSALSARRRAGQAPVALVKGAGDLASGVAVRLHRAGFSVVMTEVPQPTVVRRTVAFAEAIYEGHVQVEEIEGEKAVDADSARQIVRAGKVAVIVDPHSLVRESLGPVLVVDAIVAKRNLGTGMSEASAVVALGPGFTAGLDAHAVIETMRGHSLGRVIWEGTALPDTGVPGEVNGFGVERVLRAPANGRFQAFSSIGTWVESGDILGHVGDIPVQTAIPGVVRGLLHSGLEVTRGLKVADVDPRGDFDSCFVVSDKALAVAGGVLEAACSLLGGVSFTACRVGVDR
jgi:xanthine dehydrogenase accessory factor